jgi:hypothetical protein
MCSIRNGACYSVFVSVECSLGKFVMGTLHEEEKAGRANGAWMKCRLISQDL